MNVLKSVVHRVGRAYCQEVCRREYEDQSFVRVNERPIEFRFAFEQLAHLKAVSVLDVGTGMTALPHLIRNCGFVVTAIDNVRDYWTDGMFNRHFYVINDDIRNSKINKRFDVITCLSVLEHVTNHNAAMRSMFSMLNPGGHLVVTFPFNESRYVPNVYALPGAGYGQNLPYVCQVYSRAELDAWLAENGGTIVCQEYWHCFTGELWTFGTFLQPPRQVAKEQLHHLTCALLRRN